MTCLWLSSLSPGLKYSIFFPGWPGMGGTRMEATSCHCEAKPCHGCLPSHSCGTLRAESGTSLHHPCVISPGRAHWATLRVHTLLSIQDLPTSSLWAVWSTANVSLQARMVLNASSVVCIPFSWALECGKFPWKHLVCLKTIGGF